MDSILGLVLVGGASTRLGQPKQYLRLHGGGEPDLLRRTVALMGQCVDEVRVSCRQGMYEDGGPLSVPDIFDGQGPMSGIHAGLAALRGTSHAAMLVLPCDLPFMEQEVLLRLLAYRHKIKALRSDLLMTTYRQSHTGYIEALVSVYEAPCLSYFQKALEQNRRQINLVIPQENSADIVYTPAEARPFFNINFPEELAQASLWVK